MILHNRLFSIFYDSEDIYKSTARRLCRWRQQYSWNYVNTSQSYGEQTFNLKVSNTLDLIPELLVSLSFLPIQPVLLSQLNLGQVWSRFDQTVSEVRAINEIKNISEGLRRRRLNVYLEDRVNLGYHDQFRNIIHDHSWSRFKVQ